MIGDLLGADTDSTGGARISHSRRLRLRYARLAKFLMWRTNLMLPEAIIKGRDHAEENSVVGSMLASSVAWHDATEGRLPEPTANDWGGSDMPPLEMALRHLGGPKDLNRLNRRVAELVR